jgi:hypothetical protein
VNPDREAKKGKTSQAASEQAQRNRQDAQIDVCVNQQRRDRDNSQR